MAERELVYYGDVKAGAISVNLSRRIKRDIADVFDGARVEIRIRKKRKQRSQSQNRYYWGVIVQAFVQGAAEEWGEEITATQAHDALKMQCLSDEMVNISTGEIIRIPRSTTANTTLAQEEYHDRCRAFILEWFGIDVPLPNTQAAIDFEL
jgi:hypothetical protein